MCKTTEHTGERIGTQHSPVTFNLDDVLNNYIYGGKVPYVFEPHIVDNHIDCVLFNVVFILRTLV